uniref:Diphthamide biosynthesis protein 3 n=1 Tax=Rhodnius prolixus TaxID=13249 RepID=T1HW14_RHOPR
MSVFHDEIEIEDFEYDEEEEIYYYPCPCGDRFQITKEELASGEEIATCPSCSLIVKVIYDLDSANHRTIFFIESVSTRPLVKQNKQTQDDDFKMPLYSNYS